MSVQKLKPSLTLDGERIEILKQLIPEAVSDGKINWEVLKDALSEDLEDEGEGAEHFGLSWAGKREARRLAGVPSKGTLVPVIGEGIDEEKTGNIFIEGDNLEVLKLLQKSYAGRVKLIYIDPPYNTGNDFIYKDNFSEPTADYLRKTGQSDEEGKLLTSNPKSGGRFHSNWLNMMYPRLRLARNLLKDDGVIFVSIDDNEVQNLRLLMDEIFGEENFLGTIIWKNATDNNPTHIAVEHEYIHVYCKSKNNLESSWKSSVSEIKKILVDIGKEMTSTYLDPRMLQDRYREWFNRNKEYLAKLSDYKYIDEGGVYAGSRSVHNPGKEGYRYDVIHPVTNKPCKQPLMGYRFPESTMKNLLEENKIIFGEDETKLIEIKRYALEYTDQLSSHLELDGRVGANNIKELFPEVTKIFTNPKPVQLLSWLFSFVLNENSQDIVLDFFAGSCTTAQAILEVNNSRKSSHKFMVVQAPEICNHKSDAFMVGYQTIADIAKERIKRAISNFKKEENILCLPDDLSDKDLGLKVYKLDRSNLKIWNDYEGKDVQSLQQSLFESQDPLLEGWTADKVVTELQLLEGFPLDSTIFVPKGSANEPATNFTKNQVSCVASEHIGHRLFICLDPKLDIATIQQVRLLDDEDIFICLDAALTDQEKMMLADGCNIKTI